MSNSTSIRQNQREIMRLSATLENIIKQYRTGWLSAHAFASAVGRVSRTLEVVNAKITESEESNVATN